MSESDAEFESDSEGAPAVDEEYGKLSPEETANAYVRFAQGLLNSYGALKRDATDFKLRVKDILDQLQVYAEAQPFSDPEANKKYQAQIRNIRDGVADNYTGRSATPEISATPSYDEHAALRAKATPFFPPSESNPLGSGFAAPAPPSSGGFAAPAPTLTPVAATAKPPPIIPPVLDPPIPGNPVVVGIALTHTTLCNQPVFEVRFGDEVLRGGFSTLMLALGKKAEKAAKAAKAAGETFKEPSFLFLGVSMAPYKKPTAETNAQKRRQARQRRSHAHNANTPVTVAGTATISLGHFPRDDRNLKPKPGDWVAFSDTAHLFSSYHAEMKRFESMDDEDAAFKAFRSADIPLGFRVEKYNPATDGHKPFGICVSVANSPRSEITVLLRKDAYYNKLAAEEA